jgi:2'-5' RNA ligase
VRDAYGALGFSFEDDIVAHVTLARVKDPRGPLHTIDVEPITVNVRCVSLFESLPAGRTTRYEVLHRATLRGELNVSG